MRQANLATNVEWIEIHSIYIYRYDAHLSYNTALCHYRLKDFAPALKNIADIIERGIREHPELSVGMQTEGIEVGDVCRCLSAPLSERLIEQRKVYI